MPAISRAAKIRAWTSDRSSKKPSRKRRGSFDGSLETTEQRVQHVLVFDTETTTDKEQRLNFGVAVYMWAGEGGKLLPANEILIYADDLPERDPEGFATLKDYVLRGHSYRRGHHSTPEYRNHHDWRSLGWPDGITDQDFAEALLNPTGEKAAWISPYLNCTIYRKNEFSTIVDDDAVINDFAEIEPDADFKLMSQSEFCELLGDAGFPSDEWMNVNKPATIVGHNLPFDISRVALGVAESRNFYAGGFTFTTRVDENGEALKNRNIRTVKRGIKGLMADFTGIERDGKDKRRSYFTDTGTLAFGLTNKTYSLDNLAKAYGIEGKRHPEAHGKITLDYIHYCRQDVKATAYAYIALINELARHPIDLSDSKVYSPASIAKGYLKAMGLPTPLEKQPDFPEKILGHTMATFYGGRAEAHVRKVSVPVYHVDVTSMYPTVNSLMGNWDLLTSNRVDVREETEAVRELVDSIEIDDLFDKAIWSQFRGIVKVLPHDDLLPIRAAFNPRGSETIGLSHVTSDKGVWYSLPDVINAKMNGGKVPNILEAYRFYPDGGKVDGLKSVKLGGKIPIHPASDDFFQLVIEQKQAAKIRHPKGEPRQGCSCEGCRNESFLKVIANAGSYGIFVEVNRDESKLESNETIYGNSSDPWQMKVYKPEGPGGYCFPPIGTLITGAAKLVLGMLERLVTDAGGTWVMCDTDSMAIVASPEGGFIAPEPCLPPRAVEADFPEAIPVLSYSVAEEIRERFDSLSPYDPEVAGPIPFLKRELPESLEDSQVYCYAISAKRYAMFNIEDDGIRIITNKEHGLGIYMNPIDPSINDERGSRGWVEDIWKYIIQTEAGLDLPEPKWFGNPVMSRIGVSTWSMYKNLSKWNDGKDYQDQIKPYGFLIAPVVEWKGLYGSDFRLMGAFSTDPREWLSMEFYNIHDQDSPEYRISTDLPLSEAVKGGSHVVRVSSYRDVVARYSIHPEEKFCDSSGNVCRELTRGVLHRHHVTVSSLLHQGKETNELENRSKLQKVDGDSYVTEYWGGSTDFHRLATPVLRSMTQRKIVERVRAHGAKVSTRGLRPILNGDVEPREVLRNALIRVAVDVARDSFGDEMPEPEWRNKDVAYQNWRDLCHTWMRRNKKEN